MSSRRIIESGLNMGTMDPSERRAAVLRDDQERATQRQERLASQASPFTPPEDRIQIWERIHALSLPTSPAHKLVRIIATQTDLSIAQVQDEQRRRHAAIPGK